jgi:hypothetical protein
VRHAKAEKTLERIKFYEFREYRWTDFSLVAEGSIAAEKQGDALVKIIVAGLVSAALMASPLFAQPQKTEELPRSGFYQDQKRLVVMDYAGLDGSVRKSNQPTSDRDPMKQWPCNTAPGFCADYHGSNGG